MIKLSKLKFDKHLLLILFLFSLISIITIYSAQNILPNYMDKIFIKQILWYILGFLIIIGLLKININFFYDNIWIIYIFGNFLLLLLLFIGTPVNGAKCWFQIPGIGSFQPSELMKLILVILISKKMNDYNISNKNLSNLDEFKFLMSIFFIVLIPSILTFLEPDTGNVIIYFLIAFFILLIGGIRLRWFLLLLAIILGVISFILFLYFFKLDLFKTLLGDDFFLRINRLLDWSNKDGYQLQKSLVSIGSGGLFGVGLKKIPLYFPEAQTDFIFAVYSSSFGFLGSLILIFLIICFNIRLIYIAKNTKNKMNKYVISGILGMLIFQQFQNIGMTFGLLPITGITLPFISYGGSSLILFMIMIGVILNISKQKKN